MNNRHYTPVDRAIMQFERLLDAVSGRYIVTTRPYPADPVPEQALSAADRLEGERLMRVNHAGEVCAQALYHAQALSTGSGEVRAIMEHSAEEEGDHLSWCRQRLQELHGRTSYLDPFWYAGAFAIGLVAGAAGDKFSLGFVAETERQVGEHLRRHLDRLPAGDAKSRAVLEQMAADEARHGATAMASGGVYLPGLVRSLMGWCSKVMTGTAYWL